MPAKSVAQRRFMGMVRATQKGEMDNPSPEVRDAAKDMSVKAVREFAKTKEKNLPVKKEEVSEATYPSDFINPDGSKRAVAKKKTGRPVQHDQAMSGGRRKTVDEGMTLKDFKANRKKNERRAASADAEKRGHVGKEWHNTGRKYSPDEAKRRRANMSDYERSARHGVARDPDSPEGYGASKTKDPKKLRKQKAMGEETILERGDFWHPDPDKDRKLGGPGPNQRAREDRGTSAKKSSGSDWKKLRPGESYYEYAKRMKTRKEDFIPEEAPTMSAGDGGFSGSADANGPTAGFDPPMMGLTTKKPRKFCTKKKYQSKGC